MKRYIMVLGIATFAAALFFFNACGGTSTTTQFDCQVLDDNSAKIQTNVTNAGIVFVGTITSVGVTAPEFWSGIITSTQTVSYTVDSVLKGTYTESTITINHLLVDGSRHAEDTPGLSTSIFAVGGKLIVFAKQNTDFTSLGSDWVGPSYIDVDPDYGTIPYSSQNEGVIKSMISNPSAQENTQKSISTSMSKTLTISGADADVQSFNSLLDACKSRSTTLSNLVSQIQNSEANAVTLNIVRNENRIFVDSFNGRKVDIKDLEDWYEGCNAKTDRCQLFGHILQEYWHASVTGDGYSPSHASAITMENQIRSDIGKTTTLTGHWGTQQGGYNYMQTSYDGFTELVKVTGANVGEVTVRVSPPAAPTNLTADNSISCQITISWTDNASDEYRYSIERKDSPSGTWTVWHSVDANTTTWTNSKAQDSTLVWHTTYCYRIRAFKIVDSEWVYSNYSNETCAEKL